MNIFYSRLHNVNSDIKKRFLITGLLLFLLLQHGLYVNAQCNNTNASGSITAPAPGNTVLISACAFAGDYSTINGVTSSTSYTVTSNNIPVTDYFTIRQGTPGGPVIAYGGSPLTWTSLTAGTYYVHVNSYYSCGTQATCRTTSITNNGSCSPPVITVTPGISCGGFCVPITASGADSYTWFPYSGLFHDCAATVPYTGGNATSLYARPLTNTVYTVTGKINTTGCTGTTTTTVNYTPGPPRILPNPAYACVGGSPVKLRVTSSGTLQYCSGPVNLAVPDNNPAGVSNTIAVSGTPLDCYTVGVTVVINMAHTRIGDMVFALKAPNGQVINLDYFISGTYGSGTSTGFTNTNIAWAALNPLSSGTDPYTGTFTADLRTGATAGPTGMQPTSTIWQNLFTTNLNGNWTLGMYDGVSFETGILNSWCMKFTFPCAATGSINATPAVWSPFAGLYTDANATQAYFGIPIDSVWVKPTVAGSYTYQATTQSLPPGLPVCTSLPGSVTVIAGTPITITSQPVNQNLCAGNTIAVFSVGLATGPGPVSFQWQLSPDAGTTWYNIGAAPPYSGSNTATLTINPVPLTMNGYLFRVLMNGGSGCSGATSNTALLIFNPIPTVAITANPIIIGPTQTTTIFSTVTANPAVTYAWSYNGSVLPGEVADTLLVNYGSPGDYQLIVTNVCGVGLSNIITIANSFALNMYTYPNPSGGLFHVRYFSEANNTLQRSLMVYNNRGERIITRAFTQTIPYQKIDVDIRAHGKGLYWIELRDDAGKRLAVNRVVVQ